MEHPATLEVNFLPEMNSQTVAFILAVAILAVVRLVLAGSRGKAGFWSANSVEPQEWSLWQLLLASFLTLFAELAFIRWIAVEVRVFAYFKNLALLLCFVGFGLGCALARRSVRWPLSIKSFLGLVLIVRMPWSAQGLERISESLGSASDVEIWLTGWTWNWVHFLVGALLAAVVFLLLVWIFVPLGQIVSRQMNLAKRPLAAYSWNLVGSLLGILAFIAVGRVMLPAWFWLGTVLAGFALLQTTARERKLVLVLIVPLILLLHDPADRDHYSMWTPYQQIGYSRVYAHDGEFFRGDVQVNHTGYQSIVNLSDAFLARHPTLLREPPDENPYNLPFRFVVPSPKVMIVGSGTGNDVAAALRNGSASVDAVEIDPEILALGKSDHPEHPYDSPRVSIHLTDARAFMKRAPRHYDLILFGLLDSHTQLSDYSNMRIDNFVYTEESIQEAKQLLEPDGVIFVKFQVNHPWMATRLNEMLLQAFGKPPLTFRAFSNYSAGSTCFVVSLSDRVQQAVLQDARLSQFVQQNRVPTLTEAVPVTTDDWPYLYQQEKRIPRTYFSLGVLVILVTMGLYWQIPEARHQRPSLFFFGMGAGFLLLETQVISRLALYFGTTWQVNGIVISALLMALLIANVVVEYKPNVLPKFGVLAALLAGLLLAYWFPFARIQWPPAAVGALLAAVFSVPVFFAGLLFSMEFRTAESPSAALGANILGAVAGGLSESLSLLTGMHALLLVTIGLYAIAGIGLILRQKRPVAA